jgi:hypothetical protein
MAQTSTTIRLSAQIGDQLLAVDVEIPKTMKRDEVMPRLIEPAYFALVQGIRDQCAASSRQATIPA